MPGAPTTRARRRRARISQFEAATPVTTTLILIKRKVAAVDATSRANQLTVASGLSRDWGSIWRGCQADQLRARYAIYGRANAELTALLAALP